MRIWIGALLIPVGIGAFLMARDDPSEGSSAQGIRISEETTAVTEPLKENGLPDYLQVINNHRGEGVTAETNAFIPLWQVLGRFSRVENEAFDLELAKTLGVEAPERGTETFIPSSFLINEAIDARIEGSAKNHDELREEMDEQFASALKEPWKSETHPVPLLWIGANEKALESVHAAVNRPHYYRPLILVDDGEPESMLLISSLLPDVQQMRDLARLQVTRAYWHAGEGRLDQAVEDLLDTHRLARHLARSGSTLIELLVGIALDNMANQAEAKLLELPGYHAQAIGKLHKTLDELGPVSSLSHLAEILDRGERYMGLDAVIALSSGQISIDYVSGMSGSDSGQNGSGSALQTVLQSAIDWNQALMVLNEYYDLLVEATQQADPAQRELKFKEIEERIENSRSAVTGLSGILLQTLGGRAARGRTMGQILAALLLPANQAVVSATENSIRNHQLILTGCALKEYQARTGGYPIELKDLGEQFADQPEFAYVSQQNGQEFLLYHFGRNGVDDGGQTHDDNPGGQTDDMRIRTAGYQMKSEAGQAE
ncbi:MAG: hypothetical protein KDA78_08345 [Planctomycetaceae bacterium]|nr:hypothetical protein [Planctomycetaceae bacterium]